MVMHIIIIIKPEQMLHVRRKQEMHIKVLCIRLKGKDGKDADGWKTLYWILENSL
jgi:hypothetical protein